MKKPEEKSFWQMLEPERKVTPGEDLADSVALIVIMALVYFMIFI